MKPKTKETLSIFLKLKVIEVLGLFLGTYGIYELGRWNPFNLPEVRSITDALMCGVLTTLIIAILLVSVGALIYGWIYINWEWAKKISNLPSRKTK